MKCNTTFSIIVPTIGRPTLNKTILSITNQILPGDQLLVICDNTDDWGKTPRTVGLNMATGNYLLFMDDDDIYTPDAFSIIRNAIMKNPDSLHMFRMVRHKDILPINKTVISGEVSTQMFICPNNKAKLGIWGSGHDGDCEFVRSTCDLYPKNALIWHDEIICHYRPQEWKHS